MHETEKMTQEIRCQIQTLQALLNYLENQAAWVEQDLEYCRSTLRRVARGLITISRGRLTSVGFDVLNVA